MIGRIRDKVAMRIGNGLAIMCVAVCLCLVQTASAQTATREPDPAQKSTSAQTQRFTHYIEFRVAQIGTYGHSYVAYGRLGPNGEPANAQYADLHPMGNYLLMAVGHVLPVPANTSWDDDVLKLPVSSTYRRKLSDQEYKRLLAALQRLRSNQHPVWNAVSNNCNHFVAELAKAVGLKTPNDFQVSYTFVPALRDLNASPRS